MRRYRHYLKGKKIHTASYKFEKTFIDDCDKFLTTTNGVYAGNINHLLEVSTRAFILSKSLSTGERKRK